MDELTDEERVQAIRNDVLGFRSLLTEGDLATVAASNYSPIFTAVRQA